eukprot:CAMPEP_0179206892 /NCGR_PEP_ID=MMETSP0796-20121207/103163_1 /TAXON_ID=73915 /ORGANISM="Pyrodinium bahamense, Strain pbaha01" /LENGTH=57 /DNA_ID=CAMNT_0020911815 /DNA_START=176 /DNA_END=349 /DNA_ORIENTATION=-
MAMAGWCCYDPSGFLAYRSVKRCAQRTTPPAFSEEKVAVIVPLNRMACSASPELRVG